MGRAQNLFAEYAIRGHCFLIWVLTSIFGRIGQYLFWREAGILLKPLYILDSRCHGNDE